MFLIDSRGVRLLLVFLLIFSWTGALNLLAVPASAAPPAAPAPAAAPVAAVPASNPHGEMALRSFAVMDEYIHRPGADPSDITFKAGELAFDANRIFAFVRDNTRLEPYCGMLRGARGVLACGSGNSLDRALLLQALLSQAGVPCRIVQGTLPDAQAHRVLQQFLSSPDSLVKLPADSSAMETELDKKAGIPDSLVAEIHDRTAANAASFWKSVSATATERSNYLNGVLGAAGLKPPTSAAVQQELLQNIATHFWIQRQDDAGNWIDLDPTFPDLKPGQTAGQQGNPIDSIPKEQQYQFDLTLLYRTKADNAAKDEEVLKESVNVADAPFNPIAFSVQSADTNLPNPIAMTAKQKADLIRNMKKFQGIFRFGNQMMGGKPFDLSGNTYDVGPGGAIGNASGIANSVGGIGGGLGGALGGGGGDEKKPTFVDLRVVMTLRSPGRPPATQTRILVSAADKTPPLLNWEVYLQTQLSTGKLIGYQMADYMVRQQPFVKAMFATKPVWTAPDPWPFQINAAPLSVLRYSAMTRQLKGVTGVIPLLDRPNLFVTTHRVRANAAGTSTETQWGVDLMEMGITYVPKTAADEPAALAAAVKQGAFECTIEQTFLSRLYPGHSESSAAGRFDLSQAGGSAVQVIHPNDAAALNKLGWSDTDAAALAAAEPADHLIVATAPLPGKAPSWWTVAPDGTTVARSRGGYGDDLDEYAELTLNVVCKILCALEVGEEMETPNTHNFASMVACLAMQGTGQVIEWNTEGIEGVGFIISMVDLTLWGIGQATNDE